MSKGSNRRPTDEKAFQNNWEAIFRPKKTAGVPTRPEDANVHPNCAHPFCECEQNCKSPGNDR